MASFKPLNYYKTDNYYTPGTKKTLYANIFSQ